jgi:hypothetical protein
VLSIAIGNWDDGCFGVQAIHNKTLTSEMDEVLREGFIVGVTWLFVFNWDVAHDGGAGIYFDKFSAELAFGDEALFFLMVTLSSSFGTLVHADLFFTLDNSFSYL